MDEEDEDGVVVRNGGGEAVRFGEIAPTGPDYDALGEGMIKGNIHIAGQEEGDRFDLSAGSESTRQRQEALLMEFENRRRQRALAVTTDDKEVRRQLRELGEPMTLFGEKEMERRDRLRKHLAELDAKDGGVLPVPEVREGEGTGWEPGGARGVGGGAFTFTFTFAFDILDHHHHHIEAALPSSCVPVCFCLSHHHRHQPLAVL